MYICLYVYLYLLCVELGPLLLLLPVPAPRCLPTALHTPEQAHQEPSYQEASKSEADSPCSCHKKAWKVKHSIVCHEISAYSLMSAI